MSESESQESNGEEASAASFPAEEGTAGDGLATASARTAGNTSASAMSDLDWLGNLVPPSLDDDSDSTSDASTTPGESPIDVARRRRVLSRRRWGDGHGGAAGGDEDDEADPEVEPVPAHAPERVERREGHHPPPPPPPPPRQAWARAAGEESSDHEEPSDGFTADFSILDSFPADMREELEGFLTSRAGTMPAVGQPQHSVDNRWRGSTCMSLSSGNPEMDDMDESSEPEIVHWPRNDFNSLHSRLSPPLHFRLPDMSGTNVTLPNQAVDLPIDPVVESLPHLDLNSMDAEDFDRAIAYFRDNPRTPPTEVHHFPSGMTATERMEHVCNVLSYNVQHAQDVNRLAGRSTLSGSSQFGVPTRSSPLSIPSHTTAGSQTAAVQAVNTGSSAMSIPFSPPITPVHRDLSPSTAMISPSSRPAARKIRSDRTSGNPYNTDPNNRQTPVDYQSESTAAEDEQLTETDDDTAEEDTEGNETRDGDGYFGAMEGGDIEDLIDRWESGQTDNRDEADTDLSAPRPGRLHTTPTTGSRTMSSWQSLVEGRQPSPRRATPSRRDTGAGMRVWENSMAAVECRRRREQAERAAAASSTLNPIASAEDDEDANTDSRDEEGSDGSATAMSHRRHYDIDRDIDESVERPASYELVKRRMNEALYANSDPSFHYRMLLGEPPVAHDYSSFKRSAYAPQIENDLQYLSADGVRKHVRISDVKDGTWPARTAADERDQSGRSLHQCGGGAAYKDSRPPTQSQRSEVLESLVMTWEGRAAHAGPMHEEFLPVVHKEVTFDEPPVRSISSTVTDSSTYLPQEQTLIMASISLFNDIEGEPHHLELDSWSAPPYVGAAAYAQSMIPGSGSQKHVPVMGKTHRVLLSWLLGLASEQAPSTRPSPSGGVASPPFKVAALQLERIKPHGDLSLCCVLQILPSAVYDQTLFYLTRFTPMDLAEYLGLDLDTVPNDDLFTTQLSQIISTKLCSDTSRFTNPSFLPGVPSINYCCGAYNTAVDVAGGMAEYNRNAVGSELMVGVLPQENFANAASVQHLLTSIDNMPAVIAGLRLIFSDNRSLPLSERDSRSGDTVGLALALYGLSARQKWHALVHSPWPGQALPPLCSQPVLPPSRQDTEELFADHGYACDMLTPRSLIGMHKCMARYFGARINKAYETTEESLEERAASSHHLVAVPAFHHYILVVREAGSATAAAVICACFENGLTPVKVERTTLSESWRKSFNMPAENSPEQFMLLQVMTCSGAKKVEGVCQKLSQSGMGNLQVTPWHVTADLAVFIRGNHWRQEQTWPVLRLFHASEELEQLSAVVITQHAMKYLPNLISMVCGAKGSGRIAPYSEQYEQMELVGIRLAHAASTVTSSLVEPFTGGFESLEEGFTCVLCVRGVQAQRRVRTLVSSLKRIMPGLTCPRSLRHALRLACLWFGNGDDLYADESRRIGRHLHPPDHSFNSVRDWVQTPGDMLYQWLGQQRHLLSVVVVPPRRLGSYSRLLSQLAFCGFLLVAARMTTLSEEDLLLLRQSYQQSHPRDQGPWPGVSGPCLVLCVVRVNGVGKLVSATTPTEAPATDRFARDVSGVLHDAEDVFVPQSFDEAAKLVARFFPDGVTFATETLEMKLQKVAACAVDEELSVERCRDAELGDHLFSARHGQEDYAPVLERIPIVIPPCLVWTDEKEHLLSSQPLPTPYTQIATGLDDAGFSIAAMKMVRFTRKQVTDLQLSCKLFNHWDPAELTCGPSLVLVLERETCGIANFEDRLSRINVGRTTLAALCERKTSYPNTEAGAKRVLAYFFSAIPQ